MRAFIAIELPEEIKRHLAKLEEQLKETGADVKWVHPENIHLTLKFLGEIDEEKAQTITGIMEAVTKENPAFTINISSLGAFPKIEYPRVIWVGVDKGDKEAKEIAHNLEERIEKLGIPKEERLFQSHITLGRVRSPANRGGLVQKLRELTAAVTEKSMEFPVAGITLFKSTLQPTGPVYEALKTASLKAT
ncbi:MAG: RNA 2',3'-cyclic phosphodiesterase [Candidatus Omnitrophota bacterium]